MVIESVNSTAAATVFVYQSWTGCLLTVAVV